MALIKCPECGQQISDKASMCPHCGLPSEYFSCYEQQYSDEPQTQPRVSDTDVQLDALLKKYFGYDSFKECQKEIITSLINGKDVMAIMPTGSGKSLCYQIPSLIFDGVTVVVSPLISLMRDQVRALNDSGIPSAYINSSLTDKQISKALDLAEAGKYKLIYVAPERLENDLFKSFAGSVTISMVAVDEAHCISQWGQDFRPSYLKIIDFIKSLDKRPVIGAFTATATNEVRDDICCVLGLNDPDVYKTGFDRPNLYFEVDKTTEKDEFVLKYVASHPDESGIIYCATRKNTDNLFELLCSHGIKAAKYHAGMDNTERKDFQDKFINDELPVIVATNAFGMGIDKSNVRYVIHYNMPQSVENYYQEAGRAGRDGEPANCILLFSGQDVIINRFLLGKKDFSDLSYDMIESIRERDALRLRKMENYCQITGCLRRYILNYFDDKGPSDCKNCGNCLKAYKTIDVTAQAKKIFNCIFETKSKYGMSIISGILRGANRARLREIGAASLKSFGALSDMEDRDLKTVIRALLADGYLYTTDEKYAALGLTNKTSEFRDPDFTYSIKEAVENGSAAPSGRKAKSYLTSLGFQLLNELRSLRYQIAKENALPPYVIFSDRTLVDMCVKLPKNKEEMLDVSGIAERKYQKYGELFTDAIAGFIERHPGQVISEYDASTEAKRSKRNRKEPKEPFGISHEEAEAFEYTEYAFISEIRNRMNALCTSEKMIKLSYAALNQYLIEKGYITVITVDGQEKKVPTEKGIAGGIIEVERFSEKTGQTYKLIMYPIQIQKELVDHFTC